MTWEEQSSQFAMSRDTKIPSLYDRHKKPDEFHRSTLPSFKKISCRSIAADDSISITAVTRNSTHSNNEQGVQSQRPLYQGVPVVSFDSSLPPISESRGRRGGGRGGGRGGRGGGEGGRGREGTKRPNVHVTNHRPAKRGRGPGQRTINSSFSSSRMSDFDSLLLETRQRKLEAPPTAGGGGGGGGGEHDEDDINEVVEISDSPPPTPPPDPLTISPLQSSKPVEENDKQCTITDETVLATSPASSPQDFPDVQFKSPLLQTLSSFSSSFTPPTVPTDPLVPSLYPLAVNHTHSLVANGNQSQESITIEDEDEDDRRERGGVGGVGGDNDSNEETTSQYFNKNITLRQPIEEVKGHSPTPSPAKSNASSDQQSCSEDQLVEFKKTTANFKKATHKRSLSLSLSRVSTSPCDSFFKALEEFNEKTRNQSTDGGGANLHGNSRTLVNQSSSPPTPPPPPPPPGPRLTNPELDEEEGEGEEEKEMFILTVTSSSHRGTSALTGNTRWSGRRGRGGGGGGGGGGGVGVGGGGGLEEEEEEEGVSTRNYRQTNASSFYGAGNVVPSYGQKQVMAAKKKSIQDNLRGRQPPPLIKKPELNFTSTGKTLLSVQQHKRKDTSTAQSSNRTTHQTKVSSSGSTNLSIVEEIAIEVTNCRVGTLQEIPVYSCLLGSGDIILKMTARENPIKFTIYHSEISEIKMNLSGEGQQCIMIKIHPLPSRRHANLLRSHFKVSNQRFLNVESRNRWEWYWFLKIDIHPDVDALYGIHQWLNKLESRQELKVKVQRDMSGEEVECFLSELEKRPVIGLFSAPPPDVYIPPKQHRDLGGGDVTRRSSRIQNKESQREKDMGKLRRMFGDETEEVEEEEDDGEVTCIPRGDPKKIILTYKPEKTRVNIEISEMDLDCLEPGVYLNDRVIDFYLMYLWYDVLGMEHREKVHIFSSFFHQRLMDSTRDLSGSKELSVAKRLHDRVKSWTRHVDLFTKDYIILPVCVSSHWMLALICYPGHFKPTPPPPPRRRRKRPRLTRARNTKSKTKKSDTPSAIELISLSYSQPEDVEEEEEKEDSGGGGGEEEDTESPLDGHENGVEKEQINDGNTSCEENDEELKEGEGGEGGEGSGEMEWCDSEDINDKNTITLISPEIEKVEKLKKENDEGGGEGGDEKGKEEKKEEDDDVIRPCIMILDSLEIRRGTIVSRINSYLTEEWEVKRKDSGPMKFKLQTVYPKLLPQNNSCDCGVFVLQYVDSLFQCIKEGKSPPTMPDDWASYSQTQRKRKQLKSLITSLGLKQSHTHEATPTSSQNPAPSLPSPELIDIPPV